MQFAGQRTDMNLKPIGEPLNEFITITPDILPQPEAVLLTGITPQQTLANGLREAAFLRLFYEKAVQPDTIFLGFNSIRFDDEFMRFLHYRNFYDAYEWQWKDGNSRWDILDVARMTRALRPEGIKWPFASDGKPTNRLEFLSAVNKLDHESAHDALSDVQATIAVARLIRNKQPDLFKYLLGVRGKKAVAQLVNRDEPFVYTSSHYSSEYLHTTAVIRLADHPTSDAALVYDLRVDPTPFLAMSVDDLLQAWRFSDEPDALRLPVKTMKYNRCPAIAPLGVMKDTATQERLQLPLKDVRHHLALLRKQQAAFADNVLAARAKLDEEQAATQEVLLENQQTVDERLYDGFINDEDKNLLRVVRASQPEELSELVRSFQDTRLQTLLPLYKARNFPKSLLAEEQAEWGMFCQQKLLSGGSASRAANYFARLQALSETTLSPREQYLVEELRLYGESILPVDAAD